MSATRNNLLELKNQLQRSLDNANQMTVDAKAEAAQTKHVISNTTSEAMGMGETMRTINEAIVALKEDLVQLKRERKVLNSEMKKVRALVIIVNDARNREAEMNQKLAQQLLHDNPLTRSMDNRERRHYLIEMDEKRELALLPALLKAASKELNVSSHNLLANSRNVSITLASSSSQCCSCHQLCST